jgi:hypothetical protein
MIVLVKPAEIMQRKVFTWDGHMFNAPESWKEGRGVLIYNSSSPPCAGRYGLQNTWWEEAALPEDGGRTLDFTGKEVKSRPNWYDVPPEVPTEVLEGCMWEYAPTYVGDGNFIIYDGGERGEAKQMVRVPLRQRRPLYMGTGGIWYSKARCGKYTFQRVGEGHADPWRGLAPMKRTGAVYWYPPKGGRMDWSLNP